MIEYDKKELKKLYKIFENCGSPNVIRKKINEYKENNINRNNQEMIFKYSKIKRKLENRKNKIKNIILVKRICSDYIFDIRNEINELNKINESLKRLEDKYNNAKFMIRLDFFIKK